MSATGLPVFDKTLQTTNLWLDEICQTLGPDRQVAWHGLGAVLRTLRDRLPIRRLWPESASPARGDLQHESADREEVHHH